MPKKVCCGEKRASHWPSKEICWRTYAGVAVTEMTRHDRETCQISCPCFGSPGSTGSYTSVPCPQLWGHLFAEAMRVHSGGLPHQCAHGIWPPDQLGHSWREQSEIAIVEGDLWGLLPWDLLTPREGVRVPKWTCPVDQSKPTYPHKQGELILNSKFPVLSCLLTRFEECVYWSPLLLAILSCFSCPQIENWKM